MYCPNCGNQVRNNNFCGYCGAELIIINNCAYLKNDYEQIKSVHDYLNDNNNEIENICETIENEFNDETLVQYLSDEDNKTYFKNILDNNETEVIRIKNEISELVNDTDKIEYVRTMNNVFGDVDLSINKCYNNIERNLKLIDTYKNKINNFKDKTVNIMDNTDFIIQAHEDIDGLYESCKNIDKEIDNNMRNEDTLYILRTDKQRRENLKLDMETAKITLEGNIKEFEDTLNDSIK